ncbi:MAG: acetate--CoA ligase family protein, partial [Pseudomonadota bacterium]
DINRLSAEEWISAHEGVVGEESLELLSRYGIPVAESSVAKDEDEAIALAEQIGYPVVMKVVSPDAIHKSEAKGVALDIKDKDEVRSAFHMIRDNLYEYKPDADFIGIRVQKMAWEGYDMFIGGKYDPSFGPVVLFGLGGVYVEMFKDVNIALCPASNDEIQAKVKKLKSYSMLTGARGNQRVDIQGYINCMLRTSYLMADFPRIKELDINPLRILADGSGVVALDARIRIE